MEWLSSQTFGWIPEWQLMRLTTRSLYYLFTSYVFLILHDRCNFPKWWFFEQNIDKITKVNKLLSLKINNWNNKTYIKIYFKILIRQNTFKKNYFIYINYIKTIIIIRETNLLLLFYWYRYSVQVAVLIL